MYLRNAAHGAVGAAYACCGANAARSSGGRSLHRGRVARGRVTDARGVGQMPVPLLRPDVQIKSNNQTITSCDESYSCSVQITEVGVGAHRSLELLQSTVPSNRSSTSSPTCHRQHVRRLRESSFGTDLLHHACNANYRYAC